VKQKALYKIMFTPATIQVRVHVDNCGVPESRRFSVGATVSLTTAKCFPESQAILGRHHIVKHRVDCARKEVETSCNNGIFVIAASLLTHHSFTVAISILDYTVLNDWIMDELQRMWKEVVMARIEVVS
jgi:hypothetical protein